MADLSYDIDKLAEAKKSIDELKDNLDKNNKALNNSLSALKEAWKTDAGEKFFDDHQDSWSKSVKKYVKKLTGISDMLQKAIDRYENINSEVENLKV